VTNNQLAVRASSMLEYIYNRAVDNEDGDCDACVHFHCWDEHHPYGMGTAAERLCECRAESDRDCPVVEAVAAEMERMVHNVVKEAV
jgi:hypothetical protein